MPIQTAYTIPVPARILLRSATKLQRTARLWSSSAAALKMSSWSLPKSLMDCWKQRTSCGPRQMPNGSWQHWLALNAARFSRNLTVLDESA